MSTRWRTAGAIASSLLLLLLLGSADLGAASIEGRWRLTDQHYGSGASNLAPTERPLRLEFFRDASGLAGRIWPADPSAPPFPWPSFVAEGVPLPVLVEEMLVDPKLERIRIRYRVSPASSDGREILVAEEYHAVRGGRELEGSVKITALEGGKDRGSYVIHRRFEREP